MAKVQRRPGRNLSRSICRGNVFRLVRLRRRGGPPIAIYSSCYVHREPYEAVPRSQEAAEVERTGRARDEGRAGEEDVGVGLPGGGRCQVASDCDSPCVCIFSFSFSFILILFIRNSDWKVFRRCFFFRFSGSKAQTLLKADRNIQRRDIEVMLPDDDRFTKFWEEEDECVIFLYSLC